MRARRQVKNFGGELITRIRSVSPPTDNTEFGPGRYGRIPYHGRRCRFSIKVDEEEIARFRRTVYESGNPVISRSIDRHRISGTTTGCWINGLESLRDPVTGRDKWLIHDSGRSLECEACERRR